MSDLNDNINQNETSGTSVTETQVNEPFSANNAEPIIGGAEVISGVEPAKKKGPAKILITIAVIIVLLIVAGISAYAFSPWVKNNVKMLINDPEDYYAWVENENMSGCAEKVAEGYDKLTDTKNQSVNMELKADLETDAITSLIESQAGVSLADAGIKIPSSISFTESGDNSAVSAKINADDKTLLTANVYMKDNKMYYQIPELSSAYIAMDLNQIMEDALAENGMDSSSFGTLFSDMASGKGLQEIITDKELEELLVKYSDIVFTNIKDVKLKKDVECEVNGVKTDYNQLIAEIDEGCLYNIAKNVLKEAKKDKTIIKIVESTGSATKDEYVTAIDNLLDQLGDYSISGGETVGTMNVYVDSNGVIRGRSFEISEQGDMKVDYMSAEDGSDEAFEMNLLVDGEGLTVSGDAKEKSGKKSGTATVSLIGIEDGDMNFKVNFNDIKVENEDKGYCSGEIKLDLSSFDAGEITINLDSDGKSQNVSTEVNIDGVKYGTVSFNYSDKKDEEVAAFNDSEKVYNYTEDGAELQEYLNTIDTEGFLKNISDVIGVDLNSLLGTGTGVVTDDPFAEDPFTDDPFAVDPAIPETTQPAVTDSNTVSTEPEEVSYDFSKVEFKVNGKAVSFPAKIDGIMDIVKIDTDKLSAGEMEYFYSEDGNTAVYVTNTGNTDAAPKDCAITGLSVSDESPVKFTADGIGPGSNIADVVSKYGCKLEDPKNGYVSINNAEAEYYGNMTFFYYDGIIYELDVDLY